MSRNGETGRPLGKDDRSEESRAEAPDTTVLAEQLAEAWARVLDDERRARTSTGWYHGRFRKEWETYTDPATGRPYPLPAGWMYRLNTALPWYVARDHIHDVLEGDGPHTFRAVQVRCGRTQRRLQRRAERLASVVVELRPRSD